MTQPQKPLLKLDTKKVEQLLRAPSPEARVEVVGSVAAVFDQSGLSERERALVLDIITVLARDVEATVRAAVSRSLQNSALLPRSLAKCLADDIESVALPVLAASPVLADDDLVGIIEAGSLDKQMAIAGRRALSELVSGALVDTGIEEVVQRLLVNPGAEISEASLLKVMDSFVDNEEIQSSLVDRARLPLAVVKRLVSGVAEDLRARLVERHKLPEPLVKELVRQSQEGALASNIRCETRAEDVADLVNNLFSTGELSFSLLLRALLGGDIAFFELAMSRLAGLSPENTRTLIYAGGRDGFRRLYDRTGMPQDLFRAFWIGVDERLHEGEEETGAADDKAAGQDITLRIVRRLVLSYSEITLGEPDDVVAQLTHHYAAKGRMVWG